MGALCSANHVGHYLHSGHHYLKVDNSECYRRIFRALEWDRSNTKEQEHQKGLLPRRWKQERDARGGWYDRFIRNRWDPVKKTKHLHVHKLVALAFKHSSMDDDEKDKKGRLVEDDHKELSEMRFLEFKELLRELLWAAFVLHEDHENKISTTHIAEILGVMVFGRYFRYVRDSKKREKPDATTQLFDTFVQKMGDNIRQSLEALGGLQAPLMPLSPSAKAQRVNFEYYHTYMLRCLARNIDRGTHSPAATYQLDLSNLVDDILRKQEIQLSIMCKRYWQILQSHKNQLVEEWNQYMKATGKYSANPPMSVLLSTVSPEKWKDFRHPDRKLKDIRLPEGLRLPLIKELENYEGKKGRCGPPTPAERNPNNDTVKGIDLANLVRGIGQIVNTKDIVSPVQHQAMSPAQFVALFAKDMKKDTNPITAQQRMGRLLSTFSNGEYLNWLGIEILEQLQENNENDTLVNSIVSPLSVSALLLMAQVATASSTRHEFVEHHGNLEDYSLEDMNPLEDVFTDGKNGKDLEVVFAHSLWLPDRYSKTYGNAVNTYVAGQVGAFRQRKYFPVHDNENNLTASKAAPRSRVKTDNLAVDEWANECTKGKIQQLFGSPLYNVNSMLIGICSFKAKWRYQFHGEYMKNTSGKPGIGLFPVEQFKIDAFHRLRCRFMTLKGVKIPYMTSKDALVVNVDFASNGLQALIAIPRLKKRLEHVQNRRDRVAKRRGGEEDDGEMQLRPNIGTERKNSLEEEQVTWRDPYDPPTLRSILQRKTKGLASDLDDDVEMKPLIEVINKMESNAAKGKFVSKLTLPMGK